MPSAPNPQSPFMDSRLQSLFGPRDPGTPTSAGKPGLQPGGPAFPAPPAVNAAPPGRPATSPGPSPVTFPAPPGAVEPPWVPPYFVGPPVSAGGPKAQVIDRAPQPAAQVIDRGPQAQVIDRIPQPVGPPPPGTPIPSPLGTTVQDAGGTSSTTLSPEGQAKYQQAIVDKRKAFGPLPKLFSTVPGLPPPPIELGKPFFNPFSGRFGS